MDVSLLDLGVFLGSIVMLGINGLRQEKVTFKVTNNKSIVLRGRKKLILSSLILLIGGGLFLSFMWVLLVMAGVIK